MYGQKLLSVDFGISQPPMRWALPPTDVPFQYLQARRPLPEAVKNEQEAVLNAILTRIHGDDLDKAIEAQKQNELALKLATAPMSALFAEKYYDVRRLENLEATRIRESVFAVMEFLDYEGSRLPSRLLVTTRKVDGLLHAIGGKVEPGETKLAALTREIEEETGLRAFYDYDLFGLDKLERFAEYSDGTRWRETYFHCLVRPEAALKLLKDNEYVSAITPSHYHKKAEVTVPCHTMLKLAALWQLENRK